MAREDSEWMAALLRRPDQFPIPQAVCIFASVECGCVSCDAGRKRTGPSWGGSRRLSGRRCKSCIHGQNSGLPSNTRGRSPVR